MLVVYASKTGNVKRFIGKVGMRSLSIDELGDNPVNEPFVLVTYTDGAGQIPKQVYDFLKVNSKWMIAVAASGNRNWRDKFARSANLISHLYNVPIILKFEDDGEIKDVEKFRERVQLIHEVHRVKQPDG